MKEKYGKGEKIKIMCLHLLPFQLYLLNARKEKNRELFSAPLSALPAMPNLFSFSFPGECGNHRAQVEVALAGIGESGRR